MHDHLGKPIDPDELSRLVERFRPRDERVSLPSIGSLDVQAGLQYTGGKPALYLSLLKQFLESYQSFSDQVETLVREGKLADARRSAHGLRGVAESLGAHEVARAATTLELALSREGKADAALPALTQALDPVLSALSAHFAAPQNARAIPPAQAESNPTPSPSLPWLTELRNLLREGDIGALRLWQEHAHELTNVVSMENYGRVRRALENFEFDVALEVLPAPMSAGQSIAARESP
jgi:HPt (histidine-containing phosphotransfer) domain-containing protein